MNRYRAILLEDFGGRPAGSEVAFEFYGDGSVTIFARPSLGYHVEPGRAGSILRTIRDEAGRPVPAPIPTTEAIRADNARRLEEERTALATFQADLATRRRTQPKPEPIAPSYDVYDDYGCLNARLRGK